MIVVFISSSIYDFIEQNKTIFNVTSSYAKATTFLEFLTKKLLKNT